MTQTDLPALSRLLAFLQREWLYLAALFAGIWLRTHQIKEQIAADDVFHSIHAAVVHSYRFIFSHFGGADHCIPLTLWYKWLIDNACLSEASLRAPVLISGIAALIVLPRLLRLHLDQRTADIFACLLAVSPLLVYFSRYARPYSPGFFLCGVGLLAFFSWWRGKGIGWAALYLVAAVLGPWFHLTTLPFLLSPLLYAVLDWWLHPYERRPLWQLSVLGTLLIGGLLALLAAPLTESPGSLRMKIGQEAWTLDTIDGALGLFSGLSIVFTVMLWWGLVFFGAALLARRHLSFLIFLALPAIGVGVAVIVLQPSFGMVPIVPVRYSLPALLSLLILLSVALRWLEDRLGEIWHAAPAGLLGGVAALGLFLLGPLPPLQGVPNNWTNHAIYQYLYDPDNQFAINELLRPGSIPRFYQELAALEPGSVTLLEAPWYYQWSLNHLPYNQQLHRQRTRIGFIDDPDNWTRRGELPMGRSGLCFENFAHVSDFEAIRRKGIDYVVFHRNLKAEFPEMPLDPPPLPVDHWIERYRRHFGPPVHEDEVLVVFGVKTKPE